jgi:uncharacterized short protein YbdD (DUF466 family)
MARKRLTITEIDSVGAVDEPDNPPASLLFWKRRRHAPDGALSKGVPVDEVAEAPEAEVRLESDVEVVKQVEAEVEAETAAETVDPVELAKRAAAEEIAKAIQERDAALASLEEEVGKRLDTEWIEKAKPYALLLGAPESMGPALRKIATACPAEYETLEGAFKAALGRVELAKILQEVGQNTGNAEPMSQRDAYVHDMRKLHPDMTVEAARALFWTEHPEAVKQSREGV